MQLHDHAKHAQLERRRAHDARYVWPAVLVAVLLGPLCVLAYRLLTL